MWRQRAIRSLLLERLCSLPRIDTDSPYDLFTEQDLAVQGARRRALLIVALCWTALVVLFVLRASGQSWLPAGPGEETIFTLGVLVVATYSGFRLGQLEKLNSVRRVLDELHEQAGDP